MRSGCKSNVAKANADAAPRCLGQRRRTPLWSDATPTTERPRPKPMMLGRHDCLTRLDIDVPTCHRDAIEGTKGGH